MTRTGDLGNATAVALEALIERIVDQRIAARLDGAEAPSPWLDVDGATAYLSWSKDRLYKLTQAHAIPHRKVHGRLTFHRAELDAWLEAYQEGPRAAPTLVPADTNAPALHEQPGARPKEGESP